MQGRPERPHILLQDVTESAQTCPEVDDEWLIPVDVDDQAGSVAPVPSVAIPRARTRPPDAIKRDVHRTDPTPCSDDTFGRYGPRDDHCQRFGVRSTSRIFRALRRALALCLHGFPDTAHTWRHLLPELAGAGFHAVAPFLRGYAPTGIPADGRYQIGAVVRDTQALHEAFGGKDDAVLIGHDWGALATYGAVAHAPERWRRAVTAAVPPTSAIGMSLFGYPQLHASWYMFFFLSPLADMALPMDGYSFIDGLWADWSPGYDGSWDVARVKESIGDPERIVAAIGAATGRSAVPSCRIPSWPTSRPPR